MGLYSAMPILIIGCCTKSGHHAPLSIRRSETFTLALLLCFSVIVQVNLSKCARCVCTLHLALCFKNNMLLRSATGWFTAIANGSTDIVRNNVEKFAGQVNDDGDSGLHMSIAKHDKGIAALLAPFEGGVQNANGETPFHLAIRADDTVYLDLLISSFPRELLQQSIADDILHAAQERDNPEIIAKLQSYLSSDSHQTIVNSAPAAQLLKEINKTGKNTPHAALLDSTTADNLMISSSRPLNALSSVDLPDSRHDAKEYSKIDDYTPKVLHDSDESLYKVSFGCQTDQRMLSTGEVSQLLRTRDEQIDELKKQIQEFVQEKEAIDKLHEQIEALKADRATFQQKLDSQLEEGKKLANSVINRLFSRVPREVDENGNTLLIYAALHGYSYLVYRLISENTETGMTNKAGYTALMVAAMSGTTECVKLLAAVEGGITTTNGVTALHLAAREGQLESVRILLPYEASISTHSGTTALHMACKLGHTSIVELLAPIQAGCVQTDGISGLMVAAAEGYVDIVHLLVGRETLLKDLTGKTALMYASEKGNCEIVSLLLEHEAGQRDANGHTALMMASKTSSSPVTHNDSPTLESSKSLDAHKKMRIESLITLLISNPLEIGKVDNYGWSALMFAARDGNAPMVELLLSQEKRLQAYDGQTALMIGTQASSFSVVKLLVDAEAKMQDNLGKTALIIAAAKGYTKLVMYLSDYEAGIQDAEGKTALMFAARNGHLQAVTLLLEKEARMKDSQGTTALMYAAAAGHMVVVQALVDREGGLRDTDGKSAASYAAVCGHKAISEFLML